MGIFDFFKRTEKRSAASGFTAEVMQMRESYISGRRGLAELTSTAQSCISLWESGFGLASVTGTDALDRSTMALIGRSLALRGEAVMLIKDRLIPCSDWDLRTKNGEPVAYRVSVPEAGGGTTQTALAGEVLHVRIGADSAAPWIGQAPLRRSSLSAGMLHAVESALSEVFELAPLGSQVVPMPENPETDNTALASSFRGQRGRVLLRESVAVTAAGGPAPAVDWRPSSLSPDLKDAMAVESLAAARAAVSQAFGVLPSLWSTNAQAGLVREAQRHLAQWTLQPIAELLAEEAGRKLGGSVEIDTMGPTQAFDAGGSARAFATLVQGLAMAKEAGVDASAALAMLDWAKPPVQ